MAFPNGVALFYQIPLFQLNCIRLDQKEQLEIQEVPPGYSVVIARNGEVTFHDNEHA